MADFGIGNSQAHHKCQDLFANRVFFVLSAEKSSPTLLKTFQHRFAGEQGDILSSTISFGTLPDSTPFIDGFKLEARSVLVVYFATTCLSGLDFAAL